MGYKKAEWHDGNILRIQRPEDIFTEGMFNLLGAMMSLAKSDYVNDGVKVLEGRATKRGKNAVEAEMFCRNGVCEDLTGANGEEVLRGWDEEVIATANRKRISKVFWNPTTKRHFQRIVWLCGKCDGEFKTAVAAYRHEQKCDGTRPAVEAIKMRVKKGGCRVRVKNVTCCSDWQTIKPAGKPRPYDPLPKPVTNHSLQWTPELLAEAREASLAKQREIKRAYYAKMTGEDKRAKSKQNWQRIKARVAAMTPEEREEWHAKHRTATRKYYARKKEERRAVKNADHGN